MIERAAGRQPLAALLFGQGRRPAAASLAALSAETDAFSLVRPESQAPGPLELLRDGLTFDVSGLTPEPAHAPPDHIHRVALPAELEIAELEAVWFMAGPHLAGAEHLLPVLKTAADIMRHLAKVDELEAIVWRPARIAMSPAWFVEAVGVWLAGGPFPALALTALSRSEHHLASEGLHFLIGQDFTLWPEDGPPGREDSRIAVRLTDWLVAHGRVDSPREVILAGAGAVWLEPDGPNMLNVRRR